jgi:hypothetical protein
MIELESVASSRCDCDSWDTGRRLVGAAHALEVRMAPRSPPQARKRRTRVLAAAVKRGNRDFVGGLLSSPQFGIDAKGAAAVRVAVQGVTGRTSLLGFALESGDVAFCKWFLAVVPHDAKSHVMYRTLDLYHDDDVCGNHVDVTTWAVASGIADLTMWDWLGVFRRLMDRALPGPELKRRLTRLALNVDTQGVHFPVRQIWTKVLSPRVPLVNTQVFSTATALFVGVPKTPSHLGFSITAPKYRWARARWPDLDSSRLQNRYCPSYCIHAHGAVRAAVAVTTAWRALRFAFVASPVFVSRRRVAQHRSRFLDST